MSDAAPSAIVFTDLDGTLLEIANNPLPRGLEPLTFSPTEPFFTTVKLSFYGGILLALPILLYQLYAFVLPAFSSSERRVVLPMLLMVPVLFIAGTVFALYATLLRPILPDVAVHLLTASVAGAPAAMVTVFGPSSA